MQQRFDNRLKYFYKDSQGNRRHYGIFCPGIDRFVLISDLDLWLVSDTAAILSSKIPTLVYVLPTDLNGITQENCIDYTIFNKTNQRVALSSILVARQNPLVKFLYDEDKIVSAGMPEDYKSNQAPIKNIKEYAEGVFDRLAAINLTEAFYNPFNTKGFVETCVPAEWIKNFTPEADKSRLDTGIFLALKNVLYLSDSIKDADKQIVEVWKNFYYDVGYLIEGYYKILGLPLPDELKDKVGDNAVTDHSMFLV